MIKLRDKVRDAITGYEGIVTERHEYLNGCVRMGVTPDRLDKDGKPFDTFIFDVEQLELVEEAQERMVTASGGTRDDPRRATTSTRNHR